MDGVANPGPGCWVKGAGNGPEQTSYIPILGFESGHIDDPGCVGACWWLGGLGSRMSDGEIGTSSLAVGRHEKPSWGRNYQAEEAVRRLAERERDLLDRCLETEPI